MSQEQLSGALGVSFQQIHEYEQGVNRVGATRLFDLSCALDVSIGFFFEDPLAPPSASPSDDDMHRRETLELVRAYYRITSPFSRKRVFELIRSMGPSIKDRDA
jgi:transcriptional regulator with XRE-family HTH domain